LRPRCGPTAMRYVIDELSSCCNCEALHSFSTFCHSPAAPCAMRARCPPQAPAARKRGFR
jgi:hypothetical protein